MLMSAAHEQPIMAWWDYLILRTAFGNTELMRSNGAQHMGE